MHAHVRLLSLLLVPTALVAGLWLGSAPAARGQGEPGGAPPPRWEYRLEPWTSDDTTALLRTLTGRQLASIEEMAHALERGNEPVDDPAVQALVDARLEARLAALGADGWEVFWVNDRRAVVAGVLLPAPQVLARRRAR
ncbi:MAG: hypothetical protein KF878_14930 [Planctomycetes bacterium]|nr:hypothetical protein [Planctomycetota bacterium]